LPEFLHGEWGVTEKQGKAVRCSERQEKAVFCASRVRRGREAWVSMLELKI
jgi:hypothetical protein